MAEYSKYPKINVNKMEAARRQIREAICLFLESRDIIAVHTLATAGYQILYDLAKKQDISDFIYDIIKDEYRGEAKNLFNKAKNFFKHADRDGNERIELNSSLTEWFLFSATHLIEKLNGDLYPENYAFLWWFTANHPKFLKDGDLKCAVESYINIHYKKSDFNRALLHLIKQCNSSYDLKLLMEELYGIKPQKWPRMK